MKKLVSASLALAMMLVLSAGASAENGAINNSTLQAMGLSGMQVMSDTDAMTVRGQGYGGYKSFAVAFGGSYAAVGGDASAGTVNGFLAFGNYKASGEQGSEAGKTYKSVKKVYIGGYPVKKTVQKKSVRVFAGGYASSSAY